MQSIEAEARPGKICPQIIIYAVVERLVEEMAAAHEPDRQSGAGFVIGGACLRDGHGQRVFEAELHRTIGDALLSMQRQGEAEVAFTRALAVARQQQAKSWELRAAMSLARLWRDQGKVQQGRELLAPVYGWFTEGFDTRDLKEAKALLEELQS